MKKLLVTPVIAALAWSTELVLVGATLPVGFFLADALEGIGWSHNEAVAATLPAMAGAGILAAVLWQCVPVRGRQAMHDLCSQTADRIADWAGWETSRDA